MPYEDMSAGRWLFLSASKSLHITIFLWHVAAGLYFSRLRWHGQFRNGEPPYALMSCDADCDAFREPRFSWSRLRDTRRQIAL